MPVSFGNPMMYGRANLFEQMPGSFRDHVMYGNAQSFGQMPGSFANLMIFGKTQLFGQYLGLFRNPMMFGYAQSLGQMPKSSKKRLGNEWKREKEGKSGQRKRMRDAKHSQLVPKVELINHPTTSETIAGPQVELINHPVSSETTACLPVEPINHPMTSETTACPQVEPINQPSTCKATADPKVKPINHPTTSKNTAGPTVKLINHPNSSLSSIPICNIIFLRITLPSALCTVVRMQIMISMKIFSMIYMEMKQWFQQHSWTIHTHTAQSNQTTCEKGWKVCICDDNHNNLLLRKGCNGEHHTYCLFPLLDSVSEDSFFCRKYKEAGKDYGMLELKKKLRNSYSDIYCRLKEDPDMVIGMVHVDQKVMPLTSS